MKILELFERDFEDIDESDLITMESDPMNFESLQIEYKIKFDGDAVELRRDVVQFANGFEEGYIFFGISDDPIRIIGIEKSEVDGLKTVFNDVLPKRIEPILSPFPQYQVVPLGSGKYVLILKIIPKEFGIYAIRQSDDINNRNYYRYEFYKRMDGSKHRMNIEEILYLIESKSMKRQKNKYLEVKLSKFGFFLNAKAINKSERPLVITHYSFEFPSYSIKYGMGLPSTKVSNEEGISFKLSGNIANLIKKQIKEARKKVRFKLKGNDDLPIKLEDGESYLESLNFGDLIEIIEEGFKYGVGYDLSEIKCCFYTNDGDFCSETLNIESDIKEFIKDRYGKNYSYDDLFEKIPENPKNQKKSRKKLKKKNSKLNFSL